MPSESLTFHDSAEAGISGSDAVPAWKFTQSILRDSLKGLDASGDPVDSTAPLESETLFLLESETEWRSRFPDAFKAIARQSLRAPQDATRVAEQGLQSIHSRVWSERNGKRFSLDRAVEDAVGERAFDTVEIKGKSNLKDLSAWVSSSFKRVKHHAQRGFAEPSVVTATELVDMNPEWCDLTGRTFVVFNALSRFAPVVELLDCGATVLAIDSPSEHAYDELAKACTKKTPGTLKLPHLDSVVGADVRTWFPEIARWIVNETRENPATILTIIDPEPSEGGVSLLQKSICIDSIVEYVCNLVPETSLATFSSPTDVHCVPALAADLAHKRFDHRNPIVQALQAVSRQHWLRKNTSELVVERQIGGGRVPLGNAIKSQGHLGRHDAQARSYVILENVLTDEPDSCAIQLALLVQRWRIIVARAIGTYRWLADKRKHRVSANVLPLYCREDDDGLERFGVGKFAENEIRETGVILLIRDMRDPHSPGNPTLQIDNPLEVFRDCSFHGGVFRSAFKLASMRQVAKRGFVVERIALVAIVGLLFIVAVRLASRMSLLVLNDSNNNKSSSSTSSGEL